MREPRSEMMVLYCVRCTFGTELAIERATASCTIVCRHCNADLHWHLCESCGMGYAGGPLAQCAICADTNEDLEALEID